jgi:hypothetical protein
MRGSRDIGGCEEILNFGCWILNWEEEEKKNDFGHERHEMTRKGEEKSGRGGRENCGRNGRE